EAEAKQALAAFGVPVPGHRTATGASTAVAAAEAVGYPVVVKITDAAHKTEAGGVQLNLGDAAAVSAAVDSLGAGRTLLVEHMVKDALAELVVGVTRDPRFGLLLTVGAGGVWVEILGDACSLLLPATREQLRSALLSLRIAPVLQGYRGRAAADMDALLDALQAVAAFATAHADTLLELDINPLLVGAEGAGVTAVDALLVMEDNNHE